MYFSYIRLREELDVQVQVMKSQNHEGNHQADLWIAQLKANLSRNREATLNNSYQLFLLNKIEPAQFTLHNKQMYLKTFRPGILLPQL